MVRNAASILFALVLSTVLAACGEKRFLRVEGYVEGDFILAGPKVQGRLEQMLVEEGDTVAAGDALFKLDNREHAALLARAKAGVAQAEAELENLLSGKRPQEIEVIQAQLEEREADLSLAEIELGRQQRLVRTGAGSKRALDEAKSKKEFAEASVRELNAQLETAKMPAREKEIAAAEARVGAAKAELAQSQYLYDQHTVYAPKSGTITDVLHYPGEVITSGSPVVSLLPPENKKLRFFVPERYLSRVEHGNDLTVTCDGCGADLTARVSYIAPEAEYTPPVIFSSGSRDKLVFLIEAAPQSGAQSLKPGQPVDIVLDLNQEMFEDPAPAEDEAPAPAPLDSSAEEDNQSVERAPVPEQGDPTDHNQEQQDGPQLGEDLGDAVPLEDDAADHAQEMGEG